MSNTTALEINSEIIIKDYQNGVSTCELGRRYNCSNALIWKFLDKKGLIKRKPLASDKESEIIMLHQQGISGTDIAKQLGLSQPAVSRLLTKLGISTYNPKTYNYQEIADWYTAGESTYAIAKKLGTSDSNIHRILTLQHIKIRDGRKYHFNEKFFEQIDSEAKAYFLGMLLADGYNDEKRHSVKLSLIDKDVIEKFKLWTNFDGPIHCILPVKSSVQIQYSIELSSIIMSNNLKKYGCSKNKTYNLQFIDMTLISEKYVRDFVRGFFDGDGTIRFNKKTEKYGIGIVGTVHFITGLTLYLLDRVNAHFSVFPVKNTASAMLVMSCGSRSGMKNFLDWLYKDSTIYMDRKYKRYLEFLTANPS